MFTVTMLKLILWLMELSINLTIELMKLTIIAIGYLFKFTIDFALGLIAGFQAERQKVAELELLNLEIEQLQIDIEDSKSKQAEHEKRYKEADKAYKEAKKKCKDLGID